MLEHQAELLIENLPEGYSNYLKVQLDPYHDRTIKFSGAPTSRNASSVCLCLNQELTYTADDFPNITEPTWDAHFAMYPIVDQITCYLADDSSYHFFCDEESTAVLASMNVHGVNSSVPTYCGLENQNLGLEIKTLNLSSLKEYQSGNSLNSGPGRRALRIVGESFEVIDESPEIYQQGAVTVYRYPLDVTPMNYQAIVDTPAGLFWNPAGTVGEPSAGHRKIDFNQVQLRLPPTNAASAVLLPESQTWKAREGAYVVGTQYQSEVPFRTVDDTIINGVGYIPRVNPTLGEDGYYSFLNKRVVNGIMQTIEDTGSVPQEPIVTNAAFPFNLSGAYFTGLSTQYSVLRLRYRAYVEILTDPSDSILAPLSSPTLPYNQQLQEFCMAVIAKEPAGVPQTWNPKGEKWKKILHTIGDVADQLAPALSAISPDLSLVIGAGGRLLRGATAPKNKQKGKGTKKAPLSGPMSQPKAAAKPKPGNGKPGKA